MSYYTPKTTKLQQSITQLVELLIRGNFRVGDKLPTVRELAVRMDVSVYTIHSALAELRKNEIIGQEPGKKQLVITRLPEAEEAGHDGNSANITHVTTLIGSYKNLRKINTILLRQAYKKKFEQENPDIQVEEMQFDTVRWKAEEQQLGMLLDGDSPTGGEISQCSLPLYHDMNLIAPVDFPETREYIDKLSPEIRELCSINGSTMMIPFGWNMSYLIYNKALLEKAGVDPEFLTGSVNGFSSGLEKIRNVMPSGIPCRFYHTIEALSLVMFWQIQQQADLKPGMRAHRLDWSSEEQMHPFFAPFCSLWQEQKMMDIGTNDIHPAVFDLTSGNVAVTADTGQIAAALLNNGHADLFGIAPMPGFHSGSKLLSSGNIMGTFVNAKADRNAQQAYLKYIMGYRRFLSELPLSEQIKSGAMGSPYMKNIPDYQQTPVIPADWLNMFRRLRAGMVWEPIRSNWDKFFLKDAIDYINSTTIQGKNDKKYTRLLCNYYKNDMPNDFVNLQ